MKKIILTMLMATSIFGCNLDEHVYSQLTKDNAFKTSKDIEAGLVGVYGGLLSNGYGYYGHRFLLSTEIMTEIALHPGADADPIALQTLNFQPSNFFNEVSLWNSMYIVPKRVNLLLERIDAIQDITPIRKSQVADEARALRALTYYDLTNLYGGVPLILKSDVDVSKIKRETAENVYKFAEAEWLAILAKTGDGALPEVWDNGNAGRVSKMAIRAFLMEYYMVTKQWAAAVEQGNAIISSGHFDLFTQGEGGYQKLFQQKFDNEFIFAIESINDPTAGSALSKHLGPWSYDLSWGYWALRNEFAQTFDPADQRANNGFVYNRWASIYGGTDSTPNCFYTRKFEDPTKPRDNRWDIYFPINVPVQRFAGILLYMAESLNETASSPTTDAINYLNMVRNRAGLGNIETSPGFVMNKENFRTAVLNEQMWELYLEGKRRLALIRHDMWLEHVLNRSTAVGDKSRYVLFPIPQAEVLATGMKQNPGF